MTKQLETRQRHSRSRTLVGLAMLMGGLSNRVAWGVPQSPSDVPRQAQITAQSRAAAESLPTREGPLVEDRPERLVPQRPRREADDDHLVASAHLAQGRLLFRREQLPEALGEFERASRYALPSASLSAEIIPLAYQLGRLDESLRYLALAPPQTPLDPMILTRLAWEWTVREQHQEALAVYERIERLVDLRQPRGGLLVTRFEMARLLYITQQFERASEAFEQVRAVIEKVPVAEDDAPAVQALSEHRAVTYSLMAEAALRAKRPQLAAKLFRDAQREDADETRNPLLRYHLARVAIAEQRWQEAQTHLDAYLSSQETSAGLDPYESLRELFAGQQMADQFLPRLETLIAAQPDNPFLAFYLGDQYRQLGKWKDARRVIEHLVSYRPALDAYRLLWQVYRGDRDADAARELLATAVRRGLQVDDLQPELDDDALARQILDGASAKWLEATASNSEGVRRPHALAMAQWAERIKQPDRAAVHWKQAIGADESLDPEVALTWGVNQLLADKPREAEQWFRAVLERATSDEQRSLAAYHLSGVLTLQERMDEALAEAERASQWMPEAPLIRQRTAWILFQAKRWEAAHSAYREFLAAYESQYDDPTLRDTIRDSKTVLSTVCLELNRPVEAEEWLEQVLDEFPDDVGALNDLGYLWADRGVHLERAIRMTRQACAADPENRSYRDSLGWALFRQGQIAEAIVELRSAVVAESPDPTILDHLAEAQLVEEGPTAAVATWRKALSALPSDDETRREQITQKIQRAMSGTTPSEANEVNGE